MKANVGISVFVSLLIVISIGIYIKVDHENVVKAAGEVENSNATLGVEVVDSFLPDENSKPRVGRISHVVLHFISNASVNPKDPYNIEEIKDIFVEYGFSTHYMIDRDGTIYRMVPEDRIAYHAGPGYLSDYPHYDDILNGYSIGIEMLAIGTKDEMTSMMSSNTYNSIDPSHIGYTEEQYEALNKLVDSILKRNPGVLPDRDHIIGHDEYAPLRKSDPGTLFDWSQINAFTQ
ncbi:N-acetylmuramoyl-L-alanine amidase [Bacillus pinisoli]|uniref:N-acetylmuramoyl-L-alanine amidase n=1 Tax=Bacillus pinisoli TaxID=2901866 RepID=UPI001FF26570|nr:N-acetylmuramoyl-L-alanine amidase [Bacillus pinisoli]